jgi:hypothetical protein
MVESTDLSQYEKSQGNNIRKNSNIHLHVMAILDTLNKSDIS